MNEMIFKNDLNGLSLNDHVVRELNSHSKINIPTGNQLYYAQKKLELFERYQTARMFMRMLDDKEILQYIASKICTSNHDLMIEGIKCDFYEAALFNYNIIVDMSWLLTLAAAEYIVYKDNESQEKPDFTLLYECLKIKDAKDAIYKIESLSTSPEYNEKSLFKYLKKINIPYEYAINYVNEFWKTFQNDDIRHNYNYIKHKGKPIYYNEKIGDISKEWSIYDGDELISANIQDTRTSVNIDEEIKKLLKFDNDTLFPYIKKLESLLEKNIDISDTILS